MYATASKLAAVKCPMSRFTLKNFDNFIAAAKLSGLANSFGSVTEKVCRNCALSGRGDGAPTEMSVPSADPNPSGAPPADHEESLNPGWFHAEFYAVAMYCHRHWLAAATSVAFGSVGSLEVVACAVPGADRRPAPSIATTEYE